MASVSGNVTLFSLLALKSGSRLVTAGQFVLSAGARLDVSNGGFIQCQTLVFTGARRRAPVPVQVCFFKAHEREVVLKPFFAKVTLPTFPNGNVQVLVANFSSISGPVDVSTSVVVQDPGNCGQTATSSLIVGSASLSVLVSSSACGSQGLSTGAIVGIVVGSVAFVVIVAVAILCVIDQRHKKSMRQVFGKDKIEMK